MSNDLWKKVVHSIFGESGYGLEIKDLSHNNKILIVNDIMGDKWLMINENSVVESILSVIPNSSHYELDYHNNFEELISMSLKLLEDNDYNNDFIDKFRDKIIDFSIEIN